MNSDIIQILRKPKLVINDEISIAVFDITATFIPIYIVSKYMLGLNSPILVSAGLTIPLGYFSHKYFEVETPLGNYIDKLIGSQPPNVQNSQITT